jgi:hypothetical protein
MDELPVEAFLESYPPHIREAAEGLRRLVRGAVPDAVEGLRLGWRVIGYSIPTARRLKLFGAIGPEPKHIHLFFHYGAFLADPERILEGAHLRLRQVRYLTFTSIDQVATFPPETMERLLMEATQLATMTREQRLTIAMEVSVT